MGDDFLGLLLLADAFLVGLFTGRVLLMARL
ncbi:hypothetical protein MED121_16669 [Marinomonas sp. MED121]|nr:hypothetical protein MED121_16669 [Marinomonas sp. MED121]